MGRAHPKVGRHRRGLPDPQRLVPRPRVCRATGYGLDSWRRLRARNQRGTLLRWQPLRPRRHRLRDHQLSGRRRGFPLPRRRKCKPRPARPASRPRVGAGEHRRLRRRSRQRHRLRPVGRGDERRHAALHAACRGALSPGHRPERGSPSGDLGRERAAGWPTPRRASRRRSNPRGDRGGPPRSLACGAGGVEGRSRRGSRTRALGP
jgi:hypothetical protein